MSAESQPETTTKIEVPSLWLVKILNDDFTPMDFVISILNEVFNKDDDEAERITQEVHEDGSAVVGIYTKDIACTKANRATKKAENEGHPLRIEAVVAA